MSKKEGEYINDFTTDRNRESLALTFTVKTWLPFEAGIPLLLRSWISSHEYHLH